MYAVIIQSATSQGTVRQTVLVPSMGNARPRVFTRLGAGLRGSAGAWRDMDTSALSLPAERLVGEPASVKVTVNDERYDVHGNLTAPTVLLQKLVRKVAGVTALNADITRSVDLELAMLLNELQSDPQGLGWARFSVPAVVGVRVAVAPAVAPAPVAPVAPAVAPAVSVSAPVAVAEDAYQTFTVPSMTDPDVAVYIPRTNVYGKHETEVMDFARANQEVVAIDGHAGTGKTSSARYYSALRGLPFLRFEVTPHLDTAVTQGKFVPDGQGGLRWVYSPLARLVQQPSVILLNEFTRTSPKNATLFTGLLEERQLIIDSHQGEVINVHPDCLFIADYNSGYRGTQGIDEAVLDRFNIKLHFTWSEEAEAKRIPSEALREFAQSLRKASELEDKFTTPVTTRLLLNFVKQAQGLSFEFAVSSFLKAFPAEEQDALKMLLQVHSSNIANELGVAVGELGL